MADNDINDWQPDRNPFQSYSSQGAQPAMSDQEAMNRIPDKITMGEYSSIMQRHANDPNSPQPTGSSSVHHQDDWLNPDTSGVKPSPVYNDVTRPSTPGERAFDAGSLSAVLTGLGGAASQIPHWGGKVAATGLGMAAALVGTMGGEYFGSPTHTDYDVQRWLDKTKAGEVD